MDGFGGKCDLDWDWDSNIFTSIQELGALGGFLLESFPVGHRSFLWKWTKYQRKISTFSRVEPLRATGSAARVFFAMFIIDEEECKNRPDH